MNYGVEISEYKNKKIGVYGGKFFPLHQGHLSCIMKAQSLVDILFVVVGYDPEYDKELCKDTPFKYVDHKVRERWITQELKDFPNIRVFSQYEPRTDDYMNDPRVAACTQALIEKAGGKVDAVFSSEHEYNEYFEKYFQGSEHVVLDSDRSEINISATEIRANGVYSSWDYLPKTVQEYYVKRIALCGIESVGKSHLIKMLASHFNTTKVEEYGRIYFEEINGFSEIEEPSDYTDIAVGHCHIMNQAQKTANKVLLVDTDLVYTQYFHMRGHEHMRSQILTDLISHNAEKINTYIYIEPHNFHELDGTRRPVTDKHRQENNDFLKFLYWSHGINLIVVDEEDRIKRFDKCVEIINGKIK